MTEYRTWPDDLWRSSLTGDQILRLLACDVTFTLELNSGKVITVNPSQGEKIRFVPEDFEMILGAMLKEFLQ